MSTVTILGGGAFGTALAIAIGRAGTPVTLWMRDADHAAAAQHDRENRARLPGAALPPTVTATAELTPVAPGTAVLLSVPMQQLASVLEQHRDALTGAALVACCKGMDLTRGLGPTGVIAEVMPGATAAILTGPSFAADIGIGLPTALTLACTDDVAGGALQQALSTPVLRLYRSADPIGAEIGGALKNVIAIACGTCIGAGFGESARAALMTRGYAEMVRLAVDLGGRAETLSGLCGFGDLALTCGSDLSRNFRHGLALGRGVEIDATATVEGVATARATAALADRRGIEMPIAHVVAGLCSGALTPEAAMDRLLARPLKEE